MHLQLENVSVIHSTSTILEDISIDMPPGCRLALLGDSGAGKSTLLGLLRRDQDPTTGRVLLDGKDLRLYNLTSVLRHVGVIPQETEIKSCDVRGNVTHSLPKDAQVSDDAIWKMLDAIGPTLRERFHKDGLDTRVGKQGMRLSGGERQRICTARALIEDPRYPKQLLLVDEATSSLDSNTEIAVQRGIDMTLSRGMSAVVIAHRYSTLRNCNKFVYLRKHTDCTPDQNQVAYVCSSLQELYDKSPEFRHQADLQMNFTL